MHQTGKPPGCVMCFLHAFDTPAVVFHYRVQRGKAGVGRKLLA